MTEEQFHALERMIFAAIQAAVSPPDFATVRTQLYIERRDEAKALLCAHPLKEPSDG